MTSTHALRLLSLLALTLPACGTDDGTSDTAGSTGSSTTAPVTTTATTGSTTAEPTGTTAEPTTAEPTTADTTTAEPTTAGSTTGDPTGSTTTDTAADTTTGAGAADCGFDPTVTFARDGLVWQLESDDGLTCVWLERRDDSEPDVIYKAVPYTLLNWRAGHDGAVAEVSEPGKLTWESTHHNWMDVVTATSATVVYRLEDWYPLDPDAFTDKFGLYAHDAATDELLWGPITLRPYTP